MTRSYGPFQMTRSRPGFTEFYRDLPENSDLWYLPKSDLLGPTKTVTFWYLPTSDLSNDQVLWTFSNDQVLWTFSNDQVQAWICNIVVLQPEK